MDEFFPTFIPRNSFIGNQINYKYKVNMDLYVKTHEPCNLEILRMCKKSKWEVGHGYVCVMRFCEGVDSNQ